MSDHRPEHALRRSNDGGGARHVVHESQLAERPLAIVRTDVLLFAVDRHEDVELSAENEGIFEDKEVKVTRKNKDGQLTCR